MVGGSVGSSNKDEDVLQEIFQWRGKFFPLIVFSRNAIHEKQMELNEYLDKVDEFLICLEMQGCPLNDITFS